MLQSFSPETLARLYTFLQWLIVLGSACALIGGFLAWKVSDAIDALNDQVVEQKIAAARDIARKSAVSDVQERFVVESGKVAQLQAELEDARAKQAETEMRSEEAEAALRTVAESARRDASTAREQSESAIKESERAHERQLAWALSAAQASSLIAALRATAPGPVNFSWLTGHGDAQVLADQLLQTFQKAGWKTPGGTSPGSIPEPLRPRIAALRSRIRLTP